MVLSVVGAVSYIADVGVYQRKVHVDHMLQRVPQRVPNKDVRCLTRMCSSQGVQVLSPHNYQLQDGNLHSYLKSKESCKAGQRELLATQHAGPQSFLKWDL